MFAEGGVLGGSGAIYAVATGGELKWYRHPDPLGGSIGWAGCGRGIVVGTGWRFAVVGSGGSGVIYAVRFDGALVWYKHLGADDGTSSWLRGRTVGSGWLPADTRGRVL